jgi:beta-lactamase regulating signal transducer with metallopeptidase domain
MPSATDAQRTGSMAGTLVSFRRVATGAMFVWTAGALLMLTRLARNCGRVVQLRRSSRPLENVAHQLLLQETAAKLGTCQVPLLLVSRRTIAPLAVGFGRPAVILPQHLLGVFSDNELRDILAHEVAHLARGDQRIVLLQELAGALYWPIVSVHALNHELRRAREDVCDNVVLASRDPISYGETLLHIAELVVQVRPLRGAVGIIGGPGKLERRIAGLIDPRRNTKTTTSRKVACVVRLLFIGWGAIASATRFAASAGAAHAASPIPKPLSARDPEDPKFAEHFRGRVTGPDGKPMSGARVFIVPAHGTSKDIGKVRARTGADGRFAFDAPDMTYTDDDGLPSRREGYLMATAEGLGPDGMKTWGQDHVGLHTHWDPVKGTALNLQLATDDVPIHGRFLDPAGRPLVGARVRLSRLRIPMRRDLDAHLALVTKNHAIYILIDYERDLDPDLVPGLTSQTRTDADGRFKLSGLGRDRLAELRVSAPGVVDTTLTVMTRDAPDIGTHPFPNGKTTGVIQGAGFTLQLKPGRTIKGRVIDRDSHEPIPGMWVGPLQNAVNEFSSKLYPWVTDANGRFTITGLDPAILEPETILMAGSHQQNFNRLIVAAAPPGLPYQTAWAEAKGNAEVVIECRRGIPFHLRLVDEQGRPVEAKLTYVDVQPNADVIHDEVVWPVSRAARKADGTYQGFVLPGPGAILVETRWALNYRPARVDPKAFFAPGRTNWSPEEQISAYGTQDTLTTSNGRYIGTIYRGWTITQRDYTAIVLVNPPPNSGPLQLSATLVRDPPRQVSLIDPDGKPVVGAGMKFDGWYESNMRAASFPLTRLEPSRVRRITFIKEDRSLIGFLMARGDGDTPYTVRMQPWGTVTGRILDENGKPLPDAEILVKADGADAREQVGGKTDTEGRFRAEKVIPGLSYSARIYRNMRVLAPFAGRPAEKLVLRPGEVRDLGAIRTRSSADGK